MKSDYEPILLNTPKEFSQIEVYSIHDLHKGNRLFNDRKWEAVKAEILDAPNRYLVFVGDAMENAVPGSKSDIFEQICSPQEQKEWFAEQLTELRDRVLCVVDGNHERNRSTKLCGLYPLYDCALIAGIGDRYRPHFAFVDVGVGARKRDPSQQTHYVIYAVHKAKDTKQYSSVDFVDGVDAMLFGHNHSPADLPRGRLVYDTTLKQIRQKDVEVLNCGGYLTWGGYSADNAYRPNSDKLYKLVLRGDEKKLCTVGFYV